MAAKNKTIAAAFGVLTGEYQYDAQGHLQATHPSMVAYRGLFLIDKDGLVRHELINDLPIGRSVDEALRVVDAMQFVREHGEVCPANWQKGQQALDPSHEGVAEFLSRH